MCFSAGASFAASAVLGTIGTVALVKARSSPQRVFAITPLLFAVQQLSEGMLWLSLRDPGLENWQPFFAYTFLVFAMMVWPVWVPLCVRLLEKDNSRKKLMNVLLSLGVVIALGIGFVLLVYPLQIIEMHHHLNYIFNFPPLTKDFIWLYTLLYIMATIVAPFLSTVKRMKWLGFIFLASWVFALIFYPGFVVSIWCFFAAILSFVVVWIVNGLSHQSSPDSLKYAGQE